eukprot:TRINITY_DN8090_c0_g1_i1.p1 TRINITY_DN8090_c0_g1~~TRINITY_DN8090_c0_g1_i1.p1  ORF type:complete len:2714 (-),score=433.50 TRINITY_DN8090_c0_g1_i1:44-7879(-)
MMAFSKRKTLYSEQLETQFNFEEYPEEPLHKLIAKGYQVSRFYYQLMNTIIRCDTHNRVLERIRSEPRVDIDYVHASVEFLERIHDLFEEKERIRVSFVESVRKCTFSFILTLSDEEIKQLDKKAISNLVNTIKKMLDTAYEADKDNIPTKRIEKFRLQLAIKLLKLPFIQKRIEGLVEITNFCKSLMDKGKDDDHWVDLEYMCQWLCGENIVEYLFGEQAHPEILKRSHPILCLLAHEGEITPKHLDLIWAFVTSEGKHESIVHMCWSLLDNISRFLDKPYLDELFKKITSLPTHYYESQELIRLIIQVTERAMAWITTDETPTYGLDLFWNGVQDGANFSFMVSSAMLSSLVDLLGHSSCKLQRVPFALRCVENLRRSVSVPQSLHVLRSIITFYSARSSDVTPEEVILSLNAHHNLLDLFFNSLAQYTQKLREIAPNGDLDACRYVSNGSHYSYFTDIKTRLDFLEFLCRTSPLELQESHIDLLWDNVLLHPVSPTISDVGYNWLKNVARTLDGFTALTDCALRYIFERKVATLNLRFLSPEGFSFFEYYFRMVNWSEHLLEQIGNEHRVLSLELIGIDMLWKIAFEASNPQVGESAINCILSLQKSLSPLLSNKVEQHRGDFIYRCMEALTQSEASLSSGDFAVHQLKITRSISLIQKLIGLFESTADKHGAVGKTIKLTICPLQQPHQSLEVLDSETVGDLRKKLTELLDMPSISLTRLITSGKELTQDHLLIREANLKDGSSIHVVKRSMPAAASTASTRNPVSSAPTANIVDNNKLPSQILAEKYFDQLFQLLTLPQPLCLDVWALLMKLPTNAHMEQRLKEISPSTNWSSVLDTQNVFKLYYCLQIVNALLQNSADSEEQLEREAYRRQFIEYGGLRHMIQTLMEADFLTSSVSSGEQQGSEMLVCLALVLRITTFLLGKENSRLDKDLLSNTEVDMVMLISRLLELIRGIAQVPEPQQDLSVKRQPTDVEQVSELVVKFLTSIVLSDPAWAISFNQAVEKNEGWLKLVLLEAPCASLRRDISMMIAALSEEGRTENNDMTHVWFKFLTQLLPAVSDPASSHLLSKKSLWYFRTLSILITTRGRQGAASDEDNALMTAIFESMSKHPNIEQSSASDCDETIIGLLEVTRALLNSYPQIDHQTRVTLLDEVFHHNLFDIPTLNEEGVVPPPRCKTAQSRTAALWLLLDLTSSDATLMNLLCEKTLALYETQAFSSHWDYAPSATEKSSSTYTGLRNLGATCYMNSLVQQLHMNAQFRQRILSVEDKEEDKSSSMLYQLQSIFSHLQESVLRFYDPTPFCQVYKTYGDEMMNPLVQMDVDEFFANIMDKIETFMKGTPQENVLKEFFGGEVVNQIIPTECPHVVERTEAFLNLSLEMKNKFQLEHCLDLFIQGDMLEGDNKFHCSVCNSKVTALKRCCINKLPNFLIIHLKRFDFDLELLRRSKINQYCSFPPNLNVEAYTKEGLARREQQQESVHPESFYDYSLTGVLVHQGTTDSGHYYSFIKDKESKNWFKFNDSQVTELKPEHFAEECYGGTYNQDVYDHHLKKWVSRTHTRTNNAYMLFYERTHPETQLPPISREQLRQSVPAALYDEIWKENVTFLRDKCLFDRGFTEFAFKVLDQIKIQELTEPIGPLIDESDAIRVAQLNIAKLAFTFFVKTYSHSKDKENLQKFTAQLHEVMRVFTPSSRWFLQTLIQNKEDWSTKFFSQCYESKVLSQFVGLITTAISSLDKFEKESYLQTIETQPNTEEMSESEQSEEDTEKPKLPPKPKKKVDSLLDVSSILPPLTSTSSAVSVQALEFLLRSASKVLSARHSPLSYYWKVFEEASYGSSELRSALVLRGHLRSLLHLYLQEDSPVYIGDKSCGPNSRTKLQNALLMSSPPLLNTISTLVCGLSFPRTAQDPLDSIYGGNGDVLPEEDQEFLLRHKTLSRLICDQYNAEAVCRMCCHMGWENIDASKLILDAVCAGVDRDNNDKFPYYAKFLKEFISMEDSYVEARVTLCLDSLFPVLMKNLQYPVISTSTTHFIDEIVKRYSVAREHLLSNLKWTRKFLFYNIIKPGAAKVRHAGETLIMDLMPGVGNQNADRDTEDCLVLVFTHLLELIQDPEFTAAISFEKQKANPTIDDFRVLPLLRLVNWCLSYSPMLEGIQQVPGALQTLFEAYIEVETKHVECDEHKYQLMKCWDILTNNNTVLDLLLSEPEKSEKFYLTYICVKNEPDFFSYNNKLTPHLFSILLKLCKRSEEFKQRFMGHPNFSWVLQHMYFTSAGYPAATQVLTEFFGLVLEDQQERQKWIFEHFLKWGIQLLPEHFDRILPGLNQLLQTREDCYFFCGHDGISLLFERGLQKKNIQKSEIVNLISLITRIVDFWGDITEEETKILEPVIESTLHNLLRKIESVVKALPDATQMLLPLLTSLLCACHAALVPQISPLLVHLVDSLWQKGPERGSDIVVLSRLLIRVTKVTDYPAIERPIIMGAMCSVILRDEPAFGIHLDALLSILRSGEADLVSYSNLPVQIASAGWFLPGPNRENIYTFLKTVLPQLPSVQDLTDPLNTTLNRFLNQLSVDNENREANEAQLETIKEIFELYKANISEANQNLIEERFGRN